MNGADHMNYQISSIPFSVPMVHLAYVVCEFGAEIFFYCFYELSVLREGLAVCSESEIVFRGIII